jgi:hypothetical protein
MPQGPRRRKRREPHPVSWDAFVGEYLGVVRFLRDAPGGVDGSL